MKKATLKSSLLFLTLALAGCASSHDHDVALPSHALNGQVKGGEQPITGATIQLYAVNTTTDGGASTPLLNTTVTTSDGTGSAGNTLPAGYFSISNDYTCPTDGTLVYLTASYGNPGLSPGTSNTAIQNLVALGTCSYLKNSIAFLTVNEITTVGSVAGLHNYMTAFDHMGSTSGEASALATAFNTAAEYMNARYGNAPGPALPAGYYASSNELMTLADAIYACVNSAGGTYNDGSNCGKLFFYTRPTGGTIVSDTVAALLQLFAAPTFNVQSIFGLVPATPPFPALSSAPLDWSLPILPIPDAPTLSPNGGSYSTTPTVTLTDADTNAVLYYTIDGTTPTSSSVEYTAPFGVYSSSTVKAIAIESRRVSSSVSSAAFTLTVPTAAAPTFSPVAGTYSTPQTVTLSSTTPGAILYYTVDGSTPDVTSALYTSGGIYLAASTVIKAIAVASGYGSSTPAVGSFIITNTPGVITTYAGSGVIGYCCENVYANTTEIAANRLAHDSNGNVYFSDSYNNLVRKIDTSGIVTTIAGNGMAGFSGDGGAATSAQLSRPQGLSVDSDGNVFIADLLNNRIRKVDTSGNISTVAGTGSTTYNGDSIPATTASLYQPEDVVVDSIGDLYIADSQHSRVREVSGGYISTVAGTGTYGYDASQNGGAATSATLELPYALALDSSNTLYIGDLNANVVRKVSAGNIYAFAGTGGYTYNPTTMDGNAATSAFLNNVYALAVDSSGNLYINDTADDRILKVDNSGNIYSIAGTGAATYSGDGGTAVSAGLDLPIGITVDSSGNLYIATQSDFRIRKIDTSANISTFAGDGLGYYDNSEEGHVARSAQLYQPQAVVFDTHGNLFIADTANNRVRKVSSTGIIATVAGTGTAGYAGDGNAATSAQLNRPNGLAFDSYGNLYISDSSNARIRKVDTYGTITTFAGNGSTTYNGDSVAATSASLNSPSGLAFDSSGNLYIGDETHCRVRKVDTAGTITTFAGNGTCGYMPADEGGAATSAELSNPQGIAFDSNGNLYIVDSSNSRIRMVTPAGVFTTFAGNGDTSYSGDNGAATSAGIPYPVGVAVDSSNNVYVSDNSNRVRKVTSGTITTYAGNGSSGYLATQDGSAATSADLSSPAGLTFDSTGNLYIADTNNNRIRKVNK